MIPCVNLRFGNTWRVGSGMLYYFAQLDEPERARAISKHASDIFSKQFDDEIKKELQPSVELVYDIKDNGFNEGVLISMNSGLVNGEYVAFWEKRKTLGWRKLWAYEPLEALFRRSIDRAKKLQEQYEAL